MPKSVEILSKFDWRSIQPGPIIGVDEVGRGCLAGPVYAAAVILTETLDCSHFVDSKILSEKRREVLSIEIESQHRTSLGFATVEEINTLNIFHASLLAMKRAVEGLRVKRGHILVDGKFPIPGLHGFAQTCLVKGDMRAEPVAAASICAKVARDRLLVQLGEKFPLYGFEKHKGYSTKEHKQAIKKVGPCLHHRSTFAGVKEFL